MKKILTTSLALILTLIMLLTFAACGEKTDAEKLVGKWETEVDMTELLNKQFGENQEMGEHLKVSEFKYTMYVTYKDDGTYVTEVDEKSFDDAFGILKADFKKGIEKYFEDSLKATNAQYGLQMTMEQYLAAAQIKSIDDLVDQALGEETANEILEDAKIKGNFKIENGKMYTTDDFDDEFDDDTYNTYILDGDSLTWTKKFGADEDDTMEELYPLVFVRVK